MIKTWLALLTFAISLAFIPISALLFMWGWSLFAPTFGWPALGFGESFGITLAARLIFPASVVAAYGER